MEKPIVDYYKMLGIKKDTSPEIIKEIYHRAMMECHPDVHAQDDEKTQKQAETAARILNDIRETLLNPERRKAYDAELEEYYASKEEKKQENDGYDPNARFNDEPYYDDGDALTPEEAFKKIVEAFDNAYDKAREEEEEDYPFFERHKDIGIEYNENVGTTVENKALHSINGIRFHITQEIVFQLSKLRHRKGESFLDYSMRNRRNFAAFLVGFSLFTTSILNKIEKETYTNRSPETIQTVDEQTEEKIVLTRYYVIKDGDNLSTLAYDAGISIESLQKMNGIEGNIIYSGDKIRIPYNVSESDLGYYAEMIDVEGRSLEEIAALYETDIQTLKELNGNAIGKVDGYDSILTNQIFVPNFIGKDMLQVLKTENELQNQNKNEANHL